VSAWARQKTKARGTHRVRGVFLRVLGLALLAAALWTAWVVHRINQVASEDQAQPADAIAVFGAAEYNGRPSPVYHARLDRAVTLYDRQIAPWIVTLGGGADRDSGKSEGGVGRDYLLAKGVPFSAIIAETRSDDTSQQAELLAEIARSRGFRHVVVVSDGTHLFRIQALCAREGLDVYTSPRPPLGHITTLDRWQRYWHEVVSYTGVRLGLDRTRALRWAEGKTED
jgi:uncharacterized SAM-binding protein YcdF (DUF218 family)